MSGFKFDATDLLRKIAKNGEVNNRMRSAVGVYCDSAGKKMEGYAKNNAPWKNRTGNARQTIKGGFKWEDESKCSAYVAGNMEYSPYLELAHAKGKSTDNEVGMEVSPSFAQLELGNEGKYAILRPTVRKLTPEVITGMANLLGK
ncbi:hypothetical protein [Clostridium coskatii]|uniref:HK97 gp10 family phage protein n=1 Tax=Clostridium coskatii TaxID=1705578 RepID=A0A166SZM8_9CLOT|nr:hypothetical protein [Clostridium coskatii]OAA93007.1 hypothetical protein WX73_00325 [Clostridium coskatii]OBR90451.1 hypothetical protein CLCOS_40090 [Clostridium coskatii]